MEQSIRAGAEVVSEAVRRWFVYYEVPVEDCTANTLCDAAIRYFANGHRSADDLATMLIGTFVGVWSTRTNAPTSASVH